MDRRAFLQGSVVFGAAATTTAAQEPDTPMYQDGLSPWPLAMNTATIRPASVTEKVDACAEAGYDALELWVNDLDDWEKDGGDLKDLRAKIEDAGMFVANIIGLWGCMPADDAEFRAMMDTNKRRMEKCAAVGSKHVAVLPQPDRVPFDLRQAAARYREILEVGLNEIGIHPAFEFVSVFKGVRSPGQAISVAIDADHPRAMVVADTFHVYNSGSGFQGLSRLQGDLFAIFHWNDVPEGGEPNKMSDADRIYPGDGVLPLEQALRDLHAIGYRNALSLEMFHKEEWKKDPLVVAQTGLQKMRDQIAKALA